MKNFKSLKNSISALVECLENTNSPEEYGINTVTAIYTATERAREAINDLETMQDDFRRQIVRLTNLFDKFHKDVSAKTIQRNPPEKMKTIPVYYRTQGKEIEIHELELKA